MSLSLELDSDNNIVFGSNFFTIEGVDATRQDIKTRLGMWRGEYPYDTSEGVDYLEILQSSNRNLFKTELRSEVMKDSRITNASVEITRVSNGSITISITAETDTGDTIEL